MNIRILKRLRKEIFIGYNTVQELYYVKSRHSNYTYLLCTISKDEAFIRYYEEIYKICRSYRSSKLPRLIRVTKPAKLISNKQNQNELIQIKYENN